MDSLRGDEEFPFTPISEVIYTVYYGEKKNLSGNSNIAAGRLLHEAVLGMLRSRLVKAGYSVKIEHGRPVKIGDGVYWAQPDMEIETPSGRRIVLEFKYTNCSARTILPPQLLQVLVYASLFDHDYACLLRICRDDGSIQVRCFAVSKELKVQVLNLLSRMEKVWREMSKKDQTSGDRSTSTPSTSLITSRDK